LPDVPERVLDVASAPGARLRRFARKDGSMPMKVTIDYALCNSCGLCREVCPESAIRPTR
jgi:ferredoxin